MHGETLKLKKKGGGRGVGVGCIQNSLCRLRFYLRPPCETDVLIISSAHLVCET